MSAYQSPLFTNIETDTIREKLADEGWVLIRGRSVDLECFSHLMHQLCTRLSFDPARQFGTDSTQIVDAGTDAVGLHIENGNTPLPPDIVAFYSQKSASTGSQTTVCDGHKLWLAFPDSMKKLFSHPMTVSRTLPETLWKRYVATALDIQDSNHVKQKDLERFLQDIPNQQATLKENGELFYTLTFKPVIDDNFRHLPAFANAILGPSYNYEPPVYRFENGNLLETSLIHEIAGLAENFTEEVQWQDGDIVVIDNKRVMHGRRKIDVPLHERQLFIGMGHC